MKKRIIIALTLALSLSLALCACGSSSKSSKKSSKKTESSKDDDDEEETKKKKKKKKEKGEAAPAAEAPAAEEPAEAPAAEEAGVAIAEAPDLEAFINSSEMQNTVNIVNESLSKSGLTCEIGAKGNNTLIFKYTFIEQRDLGNASKKQIEDSFDKDLAPALNEMCAGMVEELATYGFYVTDLEIIICNADGSVLYDKTHSL